ncbi:MAG: hypothetical protein ORN83_05025 [Chthoniobacteraceae bacterium]|nr:hypothetical protein [Chthoniobacteraceae bacterium]
MGYWLWGVMSPNTMASYSISPATRTSFLPLLSMNRQDYIARIADACSRAKSRSATESALLEDIHMAVHEKDLVDALVEKIRDDPTKDSVSTIVFRARKEDTLQVTGYEHTFRFASLLVPWGKVVQSLNEGLRPNFRVYPKEEDAEIVLYLEFKRKPVMNPEDEEEVIELPMRPRTSSVESE